MATGYEGSAMIETARTRPRITKLWGEEEIIVNTPEYCGKILRLLPGYRSSLHYHDYKDETFLMLEGVVAIQLGEGWFHVLSTYPEHDSVRVPPGVVHRFWALGGEPAVMVEFSTCHDDRDVTRMEPSGRLCCN